MAKLEVSFKSDWVVVNGINTFSLSNHSFLKGKEGAAQLSDQE